MPDNPNVVALCKEYKDEASATRTEVAKMLGKKRGFIAGICRRNGITPWPLIPKVVQRNRSCQFPAGHPGTEDFHLCGKRRDIGNSLLCTGHIGKVWQPECQVLSIKK